MDLQRGNGLTNLMTFDDRYKAWWMLFILSKAFDSVLHNILIDKLMKLRGPQGGLKTD